MYPLVAKFGSSANPSSPVSPTWNTFKVSTGVGSSAPS